MVEEKKEEYKRIPSRYMMATKARHAVGGDLSQKEPRLCRIYGEDDENFVGEWVEGFFQDIKFLKSATRKLTQEEKDKWNGEVVKIEPPSDLGPILSYTIDTKGS